MLSRPQLFLVVSAHRIVNSATAWSKILISAENKLVYLGFATCISFLTACNSVPIVHQTGYYIVESNQKIIEKILFLM